MVFIGGLTRLTHSGLSITEWKPVTGVMPPITKNDWLIEFDKYQKTPEFNKINYTINLKDFKFIYLMEYGHRLVGRIAGLVFFIPFIYFICRRFLSSKEITRLCSIFSLVFLQGFLGWYMVKSGLVSRPDISQYRLAAHLLLAVIIYGLLFWQSLNYLYGKFNITSKYCLFSILLIFLQITSGGFVAGLDAGLIYNSFPLMDGKLVPDGLFSMHPNYINFFENITTVQFMHRLLALIITINTIVFAYYINKKSDDSCLNNSVHYLIIMLVVQLSLGIITLIYSVPTLIASAHQMGAVALLSVYLYITHRYSQLKL
jgi:cytochrome c oxidase assembly protein subunit 15